MAARGYEFYLLVLKVSLSKVQHEKIKFVSPSVHACNILYISNKQCQFGNCLYLLFCHSNSKSVSLPFFKVPILISCCP